MRKTLTILLCLVSISAMAQTPLLMEDSAYVYSTTGHYFALILVDDASPTLLTFTKNSIDFKISSGHVLRVGEDNPDGDSTNLNNAEISGNLLDYTGTTLTGSHGIMAGYNESYTFKHNRFNHPGYGIVIEGTAGMNWATGGVHYNIFNRGDYYTIAIGGQSDVSVYNNTFFNGKTHHADKYMMIAKDNTQVSPTAPTNNLKIKNNIFYGTVSGNMIDTDSNTESTLDCDYNVYYSESGTVTFRVGSTTYTFSEWQALGHDANSVVLDPDFIDTIDFVPTARLDYGTDLGTDYATGLATTYTHVAKSYPDTVFQDDTWQVGAVLYRDYALADRYIDFTNGTDSGDGNYNLPWKTIQYLIENQSEGDTVMFRDGIWPTSTYYGVTHDAYYWDGTAEAIGAEDNPIVWMAYPEETPVIDFSDLSYASSNIGLLAEDVHHFVMEGLTWQYLPVAAHGPNSGGIKFSRCTNITIEECVFDSIGGPGILFFGGMEIENAPDGYDTTQFINNDFFYCRDTIGNHGDGIKYDQDSLAFYYFYGNRGAYCSDDFIDISGSASGVVDANFAFAIGWMPGDSIGILNGDSVWVAGSNGNGLKIGSVRNKITSGPIITNNLVAYCRNVDNIANGYGYDLVDWYNADYLPDSAYKRVNARNYNNTSFANGKGFAEFSNQHWDFRNCEYYNNIADSSVYYQDRYIDVEIIGYPYPHEKNTWYYAEAGYSFEQNTDTINLTLDDYVAYDSITGAADVRLPRVNGEIPWASMTFLKLAEGSDLIDAGVDVTTTSGYSALSTIPSKYLPDLSYNGDAPDIGYYETDYAAEPIIYPMRNANGVMRLRNGKPAIPRQ